MGAFAQTTTVEPTEGSIVEATTGYPVKFNFTNFLALGTFKLELTSFPDGANTTGFTQEKPIISLLSADLLGAFDEITPTVSGDYVFTLKKRSGVPGFFSYSNIIDSFTLQMTDETLSNKKVENSSEFSATCNAGILTITNASEATGVSILSISGVMVYSASKAESSIDVSSLASGIYVLVVEQGGARITKKFIKN
ncbi:hypothetical protein AXE80_02330 [Wenyingzhuangia fucanilytica]|uniref:Secretion system C-terminal sorting domain-containing protein n=2 Tax=Wenyingzhuangia fucanilytica TaxID=1790137 RepID=A0A1B1Y381_9FLAO|nr:hypothetical protein AXE80_02330 [Wenyingzhuangia fucanilytica]